MYVALVEELMARGRFCTGHWRMMALLRVLACVVASFSFAVRHKIS